MIHQKQQQASSSSQSGFTIIESLIAVVVVGILLVAIAPVIIFSVATRLQARRIELATNAAQTYIDGIRSSTIPPPPIVTKSTAYTTDPPSPDAPSGTLTCPTTGTGLCEISPATPSSQLYCVDGDTGGCTSDNFKDMIVQGFGYNPTSDKPEDGYRLGLRVYRRDAFNKPSITLKASKDPGIKQAETFTKGTGLISIQAPLVEMTTEISSKVTTFSDFCQRLKPPANNPNPKSHC
ncbi:type II secretion system protein [Brasilonema octagenarum UFV-E1]|uniref:Type II secretion system protein n=1 Tax=Brasilonema sennae CENA114 TaxID=415709 RepID=A0A856MMH8_9CYAN|nr:hormogonium polysaccharide secretion pseudopilin HpsB [Brasilonema sennae]QDL11878.1 type II secretion system protein [Brasilonema sennae CENA114]QDL18252.1 type II secretion system protein [Brasilonema octagenarum UFV-E1]